MMHMRGTLLGSTAIRGRQIIRRLAVDTTPAAFIIGADQTGDQAVDPGATVSFPAIDVTGMDAGEDITAQWTAGSTLFRVLDTEGGAVLRDYDATAYTGPGRRIEFQDWTAGDAYSTDETFTFDINGVSDSRIVSTVTLTATTDGTSTTYSTSPSSVDLHGDGTVFVTPEEELPTLDGGPLYDNAYPPGLAASGSYGIAIDPGLWWHYGNPEDFTILLRLRRPGGAILVENTSTEDDVYGYSEDPADGEEVFLEIEVTAPDSNGVMQTRTYASAATYTVPDRAPDDPDLTGDVPNAELSTLYTSNPVQLTGTNETTEIAVEDTIGTPGGQYRLADDEAMTTNVTAWTSDPGTYEQGQWAQVRGTSAGEFGTPWEVRLQVGRAAVQQSGVFSIETVSGDWSISGSTIQSSPTVAEPTVSGSQITG